MVTVRCSVSPVRCSVSPVILLLPVALSSQACRSPGPQVADHEKDFDRLAGGAGKAEGIYYQVTFACLQRRKPDKTFDHLRWLPLQTPCLSCLQAVISS